MAVVAVGDFDKAAIETLVKNHFETIPASAGPKLRPTYDVPEQPGTLYAIATDKEASGTSVCGLLPRCRRAIRPRSARTVSRSSSGCSAGCCPTRFSEMAQKPDAPFLGAGAGRGQFVRPLEVSTLSAGVKEDGIERGLDALFTEALRVEKFGFTATEFDRVRSATSCAASSAPSPKRTTPHRLRSPTNTSRNFTDEEPSPGIEYEMGAALSDSCRRLRWPRSTRSRRNGCPTRTAWSS